MKNFIVFLVIGFSLAISVSAQKTGAKKPADTSSGSQMDVVIEKGGIKTEIKSSQFQTRDGNAFAADQGRLTLFFGASNSNDARNLSFNGWIPAGETGVFKIGDGPGAGFSLITSVFSNIPMFLPEKGGTIEITDNPKMGGFVVGTFHGTCKAVTDAGTLEEFTISGSFRLARR